MPGKPVLLYTRPWLGISKSAKQEARLLHREKWKNLPAGEKTGLEVIFSRKNVALTISLSSSKTSGSLVLSQRRRDLSWDADTT